MNQCKILHLWRCRVDLKPGNFRECIWLCLCYFSFKYIIDIILLCWNFLLLTVFLATYHISMILTLHCYFKEMKTLCIDFRLWIWNMSFVHWGLNLLRSLDYIFVYKRRYAYYLMSFSSGCDFSFIDWFYEILIHCLMYKTLGSVSLFCSMWYVCMYVDCWYGCVRTLHTIILLSNSQT